jgi:hypothetical protein
MMEEIQLIEELESLKRLLVTATGRVEDLIEEKEHQISKFEEYYTSPF